MKKILVIEDNKECRKMLDCIIRHLGYEVIQAESGLDGLAKSPDLIFISLDFPEMRGLAAIISAKNNPQTAGSPILVYPPWDSEEATQAARSAGATEVLTEPFTLECFRQVLQKYAPYGTGWKPEVHTLQ